MFERQKQRIVFVLCLSCLVPVLSPIARGQDEAVDEKIMERYKQMLSRKPKEGKEGSPFDRLYKLYLDGPGLEQMVADYRAEAQVEPDNPNTQLILGHIYKRLGRDGEALAAYKRAVALAPADYYPHSVLGQMYFTLRRHEDAIGVLTQAAALFQQLDSVASTEELLSIYKSLGRAYFNRDRVDEAIAAWGKISELDPTNIFVRIELAELFCEQKLYERAIEQHRVLIQIKQDDPYRICLSLREIGSIQEEMDDYRKAMSTYDAALVLTVTDNWLRKDLQRRIIAIYAATGDWDGLIEYYQKKLADTPNDPELMSLLADAYLENEQVDEGIAQYRKSVELVPTSAPVRQKLIAALRRAEKFAEAAAEYETLTVQLPDDFGIYRSLGALYLQLEQPARARAAYERMLARNPENASTHLTLAEIYAGHEWFDEAIAAYEKAIALAPANLDYIEYLGEFYFRRGDREKTVETWNRLVEGERAVAQNYDRLAQLLNAKDFQAEAVTASRKAVKLAPTKYQYREALAKRLIEAKNFDEAITQFTEATKHASNDFFAEQMAEQQIEVYRQQGVLEDKVAELEAQPQRFDGQKLLAKMYLRLKNTTAAAEALEKALPLNSDDVPVNRSLAEIYVQLRRHDNAKAAYARLIALDSGNAREYHAELARLHLGMMDFDAAKEAAKQVLAHSPRNPKGHQILAEIALKAGDYLSGVESLKQAVRLRPEATKIRVELAEAYKLADNPRQAVGQYWRCWELSDNLNDKLGFVKLLSDAYYDMGRQQEFTEKLQQMSKTNPSDIAPVLAFAELYRIEGDLSASRTQLARALDRDSENSELLSQLVDVSLKLGETQDALTYQQRLVAVEPDALNQQRLGKLLFDVGREQEAVQVWTKLLHAKNQTLEALMKLAELLIQYDLRPLAFSALDRIAEQVHKPKAVYRLGAILVEMGELERARPYFERILQMPKPQSPKNAKPISQPSLSVQDPLWRIRNTIHSVEQRLDSHGGVIFLSQGQGIWLPSSFEDTQAAALAQLIRIARQREELQELINGFEAEAAANPKDLQLLERLLYVYTMTYNDKKAVEVVNRLVTLSPDDPTYRDMQFQFVMQDHNPDYETVQGYLAQIPATIPQVHLQYTTQSTMRFLQVGKKSAAEKLLAQFKNEKMTDLATGTMLITAFSQLGDTETAEKMLAHFPVPTPPVLQPSAPLSAINRSQMWQQYTNIYQALAGAYIDKGETDKGVEVLWSLFERTQPNINTSHWMASSAYSRWRTSSSTPLYPAPNTYYDRNRFELLRQLFGYLWLKDQLDILYTKLQMAFEQGNRRERIFSGLALSYCYWWEGRRDESQQLLETMRAKNNGDLTLKLHMPLVLIQTGKQEAAISLLTKLADSDPRNRLQYIALVFRLALQRGNTTKIRELVMNLLNSPASVRELHQFSERLHEVGLTQYAIAIAKKAADLAMGQNDLNSLSMLSQHLEALGRGQEAAALAKRVARLTKHRIRPGQAIHPRRQATRLSPREALQREPRLVEAAEKHPNSFQAQADLAALYESTNQTKKAIPVLAKAVALRPKNSRLRKRYAGALQRDKQMDKAVEQYSIVLREDPSVFVNHDIVGSPINIFMEAGKLNELVAVAKEMIASSGGWYETNFAEVVARKCVQNNAPKLAIEFYEKLIEVRPSNFDFYLRLSHAYTAVGERERAIECVRDGLKVSISSSKNQHQQERLVSRLIKLSRGTKTFSTLIADFEAQLATKPNNLSLTWLIAYMHIKARQLEASDIFVAKLLGSEQKIIEYSSGMDPQWFTMLADAYRQVGDHKRQMKLLEAVIEKVEHQMALWDFRGITSFYLYRQLGATYVQNGKKEKAQQLFRKIIPIRMALSWDINNEKQRIAELYMRLEMWDDAETLFTEIANNFFVHGHGKQRAQKGLIKIRKERGDLPATPQPAKKIEGIDIRLQRKKAEEYTWRGEIEKAVGIYKQLIAKMPEDHRSHAALARLYSKQSRHDEAISTWRSLLKVDPENTQYRSGLAEAYRAAGMFPEALEIVQKLIAENPSTAYYSQLALVYIVGNRFNDAIKAYQKGIELTPNDWRVYKDLAQLYAQTGDLETAEKTYKTALQLTRNESERRTINKQLAEVYLQQSELEEALKKMEAEGVLTFARLEKLAQKYHKQGKLEEAAMAYKKAFGMAPGNWYRNKIVQQLFHIYRKQGSLEEILAKAEGADTPAAEINIELQKTLAKEYMEMGEIEKAIEVAKQVIVRNPEDHKFRAALAKFYTGHKMHDEAIVVLKKLIEADPKNKRYRDQLASAYRAANRLDDAVSTYRKAIELNPGNRWLHTQLARLYIQKGDIDAAEKMYKTALQFPDEESGRIYEELGQLYMRKGDFDAAEKTYKEVRMYRELGKLYIQKGDIDAAEQTYKKAGMYRELGKLYIQKGDIDAAEKAYKKAVEFRNKESGRVYDELGQLYTQKDDIDAAEKAYKKAVKFTKGNWERRRIERQLMEFYRQQGKLADVLKKAEAEGTLTFEMLRAQAREYRSQGKLEEAATAYKKVLGLINTQNWEHRNISWELLTMYQQQSNWEEAFKRAEAEGILTSEMVHQQGQAYRKQGKLEEAITTYKKAIEMTTQNSRHSAFDSELLSLYIEIGDVDAAVKLYEISPSQSHFEQTSGESFSYTPSGIKTHLLGDSARKQIIEWYKQQGKLHELVTYFESRFKQKPESPAIVEILAEAYNHQNEHAKAAEKYQQLSRLQPAKLRTFYLAAAAFNRSGQPERTKEMLQQGATGLAGHRRAQRSVDSRLLGTIATICIDGELYDTAITFAEDAITEARRRGDGWVLNFIYPVLGKAFIDTKRYEETANAYYQLRDSAENRRILNEADAALQKLYKVDENLFDQLVAKRIEAVEANPDDADAHYALAQTYESNGKLDEAIAVYEKLSELQSNNVEWLMTLGDLYQQPRETAKSVEGNGLRLNDNGSFVELNDNAVLNAIRTQLTVEAWIKPTRFYNRYILYKGDTQNRNLTNRSFALWMSSSNAIRFSASPDGWQEISTSSPRGVVLPNRWHHIAGVLDTQAGLMKLYIDGLAVASRSFPKKPVYKSQLPLRIGFGWEEPSQVSFKGELADVRIWNTVRTTQEIQSHMNVTLTGDEPGLVGFVQQFGESVDTPPNHLSGRFVSDVEVVSYTRPLFAMVTAEHLTKAAAAYEKVLALEPRAYSLYETLAKTYFRLNRVDHAAATYRRAIDAPLAHTHVYRKIGFRGKDFEETLDQSKRDSVIRLLWRLYADRSQFEKGIATLEALKPKMASNATLNKLLGDAYKEVGDSEKSDAAYAKWVEIHYIDQYSYSNLASQLLDMEFMPEQAVKFAKLAGSDTTDLSLLGRAYLANRQYVEALEEFKHRLSNPAILTRIGYWSSTTLEDAYVQLWLDIAAAGRRAKDRARYIEMIENLVNAVPDNPTIQLHANLELSKLYHEQVQLDKSREHLNRTGMITGNALWIIGPFDNSDGNGYRAAYIPEGTPQLDTTVTYPEKMGAEQQLAWKQLGAENVSAAGSVALGKLFDGEVDSGTAYATTTMDVPTERTAQIRFGSDGQIKFWLDSKEIFARDTSHLAVVDGDIIPVTLNAGDNRILVKVCRTGLPWRFYLRITDTNGKPFEDLEFGK